MKKILSIIVNEKKEFLLLDMNPNDKYLNKSIKYTVTGSMEDIDENIIDTVKREVEEELNLKTNKNIYQNLILRYNMNETIYDEYVFISEIDSTDEIILNEEVIDYTWYNKDNYIKNIDWYGNKEILIKMLDSYIEGRVYLKKLKIIEF